MAIHGDPTATVAIGSVNREWKRMVRRAISLRKTNREPTPEERRMFTGIYKQLLSEPMNILEMINAGKGGQLDGLG